MAIEKLVEFAKEGSKSIAGLVLLAGFPREEKPAREWFNYLFNLMFKTINDLIDEINLMRIELEYLKKYGALPADPDAGDVPVVDPEDPVIPPEDNPVGTWTVTQLTRPVSGLDPAARIGNVSYLVTHSSGKQVKDVVMTWAQVNRDGGLGTKYVSPAKDSDEIGEIIVTFASQYPVANHPNALVTVTAPGNPLFSSYFNLATFGIYAG